MPAAELVIRIFRIRDIVIFGKNDNGLFPDNIVIVDGVAILILDDHVRGLEHGLVANVATLILHPYDQGLGISDFVFKSKLMLSERQLLPIVFSRRGTLVVSYPICRNTGTATVLDKRDAVLINTHSRIGQRDGGDVFPSVGSLNIRVLVIEKYCDVGLRSFGLIAKLILHLQLERPASRRALVSKIIGRDTRRIGHPPRIFDNVICRIVDLPPPFRNRAIVTGKSSRLRIVLKPNADLAAVDQVLLMHCHQLLLSLRIEEIEVGQRKIGHDLGLVKFLAFYMILVNPLRHLGHIIVAHGNKAIVDAETLMIVIAIGDDLPILSV